MSNGVTLSRDATSAPILIGNFMCTGMQNKSMLTGLWQLDATHDNIVLQGYIISLIDDKQQFLDFEIQYSTKKIFKAQNVKHTADDPLLSEGKFYRVHVRTRRPTLNARIRPFAVHLIVPNNVHIVHGFNQDGTNM